MAVIDGYVGAARTVCRGGVARAGIDVYRIKTYGQQVEDQHVWYLSRRFIWISRARRVRANITG